MDDLIDIHSATVRQTVVAIEPPFVRPGTWGLRRTIWDASEPFLRAGQLRNFSHRFSPSPPPFPFPVESISTSSHERPAMVALKLSIASVLSILAGVKAGFVAGPAQLAALNLQPDYIIVGGGTAGSVVASRLSEWSNLTILLLEAGGSDAGVSDIIVPFLCFSATPGTPLDWNYTTTAQPGLGGRSIPYPRGYVLGGSSSVNYMMYNRGSQDDWNNYAKVAGDNGWSWGNVYPYMLKSEKWTAPADGHNTTGEFNPAVHSNQGLLSVSLPGAPSDIDTRVVAATQQLSSEFPANVDVNSGKTLGVAWMQASINGAVRSSSSTAYLSSGVTGRSNLNVALNTRVTRILPVTGTDFRTVEYVDASGKKYTLTAKKEVILSAGSIGTPSILMHSGIGDSAALKPLGITPLVNLPSVGKNMSDHVLLPTRYLVNSTNTLETIERSTAVQQQLLSLWQSSGQGPFVNSPGNHIGFFRVPTSLSKTFAGYKDASAGPTSGHYEFIIAAGSLPPAPPAGNFMGIIIGLVSPTARGSVTISSSNPLDAPLINPNLVGTSQDQFVLREAMRASARFAAAPAFDDYVLENGSFSPNATDSALNSYIAANAQTVFHPVGTASMSPYGAQWGVVNPDLTVKKTTGLRIVDLSVLPVVPAGHPQGPAYFLAERASDLIKYQPVHSS
ncbi:unnamed protein product [Mycena citricolor]|uniref:Glucose-methanol-choline oxidoreductase N-terminal domain-containing protein n=1 Tax=Mycena citricolor TaxID=2018698 RepID=A0AAD2JVD6_9AGAR|nr:unnamed protein product [Mycena citricolor]